MALAYVFIVVQSLVIVALICSIRWLVSASESREVSFLKSQAEADHRMCQNYQSLTAIHLQREANLQGDIRALTESLGRSKEYVQVVYPRDAMTPLEPSPGWFDSKPNLKVIPINVIVDDKDN